MKTNGIGSTFDSFLEDEGILEEVDTLAQKRIVAWQIERAMAEQNISKVDMAERMKTSRSQVDRLLDPENNKVQLDTLQRAALAVGGSLRLELTGVRSSKAPGHTRKSVMGGAARNKIRDSKTARPRSAIRRGDPR
ncbi:MAG TPA: helix-turn-helix transcriptional regulator [Longimicrobiales bacterium]|nr:helix-turn-helix transcriptional regulator [Longimicrobiales bacterium]